MTAVTYLRVGGGTGQVPCPTTGGGLVRTGWHVTGVVVADLAWADGRPADGATDRVVGTVGSRPHSRESNRESRRREPVGCHGYSRSGSGSTPALDGSAPTRLEATAIGSVPGRSRLGRTGSSSRTATGGGR